MNKVKICNICLLQRDVIALSDQVLLLCRIESSDLPLLAAVASTHSPYVAQILL